MTAKRLLLTGAGGMLGRRVLEILLASGGYRLFVATTNAKKYSGVSGVTPLQGDLLKPGDRADIMSASRPSALIHLAWDQRKPDFRSSLSNYDWLEAGISLIKLFAQHGGRRALCAGSSSEYEERSCGMTEDGRGRGMSPYGECKLAITRTALSLARAAGVSLAVSRFFTIYGEDDPHEFGAIPSAIRALTRGESVTCKSPWAVRDYVYAGDAAAAAVKIFESGAEGVINVASGRPQTMREVFAAIAGETNRLDLVSFAFDSVSQDILAADISRLSSEIGFRCDTDFRSGIRKCVEAAKRRLTESEERKERCR